jgi:hypothetical protein
MWHHEGTLRTLGFHPRSDRYRQCVRRYGLQADDHISVYSWSEVTLPDGGRFVELTEFHVTFYRGGERLHFYYHETHPNHWQPAGHTSTNEILRLGLDVPGLRAEADAVASALVEAMEGVLVPR